MRGLVCLVTLVISFGVSFSVTSAVLTPTSPKRPARSVIVSSVFNSRLLRRTRSRIVNLSSPTVLGALLPPRSLRATGLFTPSLNGVDPRVTEVPAGVVGLEGVPPEKLDPFASSSESSSESSAPPGLCTPAASGGSDRTRRGA